MAELTKYYPPPISPACGPSSIGRVDLWGDWTGVTGRQTYGSGRVASRELTGAAANLNNLVSVMEPSYGDT